jgi:glycosyltransferase involved in cell wall biosynthesis
MKNKKIFFSIICPIYNLENFIKPLINTIKNQSYKNFEILFVNDGSTDTSIKLLKKNIIKTKMKYTIVNSKKNRGPGWARNKAIKLSNYEWVAFLDGDDLWHKDKLRVVKEQILIFRNKNFFIHWEKFFPINGNKNTLKHGRINKLNDIKSDLYKKNFFSTSAVVLNKNIIENQYFNENLPNAQDYEFWLRISKNIEDHTIKKVLGYYIERNNNITSRGYLKKLPALLYICIKYMNYDLRFFIIKLIKIFFTLNWIR